MKILITGGCGFVGSNVALKLDQEHEVYCLDNFSKHESKLNEGLIKKYVKYDICNPIITKYDSNLFLTFK